MTTRDIIKLRLINQQIAYTHCKEPAELVSFLIAMQAQEYPMAKWAIGLRLSGTSDKQIEEDFNKGLFLRTHILRPTWHFVSPVDIRWIQTLTAPNVHAFNGYYYRRWELDARMFSLSMKLVERMLQGKNFLSRKTIQELLQKNKIKAIGERLALILMFAELEGLICSGPRIGKQFTYALLDERSDRTTAKYPASPLAELTRRYFTTRGPATAQDFMWWSGLKAKAVKQGIESLPTNFEKELFNGQEYIFLPLDNQNKRKMQSSFLLPDYDEYGISYKNRDAYASKDDLEALQNLGSAFSHYFVVNGKIGGKWKKINQSAEACFLSGSNKGKAAVVKALKKFSRFLNFN
jgi:hypothetical protein